MSKMINGKSVDCMATSLTIKSYSIDNFLQKIGHTGHTPLCLAIAQDFMQGAECLKVHLCFNLKFMGILINSWCTIFFRN